MEEMASCMLHLFFVRRQITLSFTHLSEGEENKSLLLTKGFFWGLEVASRSSDEEGEKFSLNCLGRLNYN